MTATTDLASMYINVRERVIADVSAMNDTQLATTVPACPEWTVHGVFSHVASLAMTIMAGDIPESVMGGGDPNPWLAQLVADNAGRSVDELAEWWRSNDEALRATINGAGLLLVDLFTHESDIQCAVGSTAHRSTAELDSQVDAGLAGLQSDIAAAGLPPICVDNGTEQKTSGQGEPGWTLRAGFWEAHRVLNSRRTTEEMLALPHDGDPSRYFELMHHHLPLPVESLGEH